MEHCTGVALLALTLLAVCAHCKWVRLDPCDERCECMLIIVWPSSPFIPHLSHVLRAARPDGTDIVWPVEVDDSNGTLRYRYPLGPPPFGIDLTNSSSNSSKGGSDVDNRRMPRAATAIPSWLWPGGIVYYDIGSFFTGTWVIMPWWLKYLSM